MGPQPNQPNHGISKAYEFWFANLPLLDDKKLASIVLDYVKYGIPIGFTGERSQVFSNNWNSAMQLRHEVTEFIDKHLRAGNIEEVRFPSHEFRASPLGAFSKKNSGKTRVIHDLSWPTGISTNDGIRAEDYSVSYATIDDAVKLCSKTLTSMASQI